MRGSRPPDGLGPLISSVLHGLDLETRVKEQTCLLVWDEVVGEQVADAAQPEFIRDGRMFVITKSSVWANELTFYKSDMIARLNRRVGRTVLKDIVFKVGRLPRTKRRVRGEASDEPELEGIQLTDRELEGVEVAAQEAGEGAAEMMRSLMATALRLEKWKKAHGWVPCKKCGALQNTASGVCPLCLINL